MARLLLIVYSMKLNSNWQDKFVWNYLKSDTPKTIILFCSCLISFCSLLLSSGFYVGSNEALSHLSEKILDSSSFNISKKEYLNTQDSPVSLVRSTRPEIQDLLFINNYVSNYVLSNDYSRLFPGNYKLKAGEINISEVTFCPIYSFQELFSYHDLLCDGDIPRQESINYVAINKSFADSISSNNNSVIGTLLWLEIQSPVTYQNDDGQFVDDVFLFQGEVMIKAVFQELSFLNTPKIFYSLVALENLLSSYILEDISDLRNANTSCVELFDLLGSDHYLLNYGLNLFALDQDSIEKISMLSSLLEENESFIAIESPAMMIKQSYSQLSLATIYSMLVFVVIAFIGTCCIMGIGSYSNYVAKKKESAILSTLGASKRNIRSIFFSQSLFVSVSAGFVSIILAIMLTKLINPFLENNFMTKSLIKIPFNYFLGIPYGLIIFLLLISILMSFLFTSLPLSIYKGLSLADELRDN